MATQADVRRIALAQPGAEETPGHFAFAVRVKGKPKGFAWVWMERMHPKRPRVPQPAVLALRVASLTDKDLRIAHNPGKCFTEPHYEGFPAILIRLAEVTVRELGPLIADAWRTQAPQDLTGESHATAPKAPRRRPAARRGVQRRRR